MLWLFLSIFVAAAAAICTFIDNYISDVCFKGKLPQAQKIFGILTYTVTCIVLAIVFPIQQMDWHLILIFFGTGILSSLGAIAYFKSFNSEDATGVTIFIQLAPIMYLIAGWTLLGEHITFMQIIAFVLLIAAPVIVVLFSSKRSQKLRARAAMLIAIYLLFVVTANIIFIAVVGNEEANTGIDFHTAFFYAMLGKLVTNFTLTLMFKSWRQRFRYVVKTHRFRLIGPMIITASLFVTLDLVYRLALTIGPVALVSATANSLQLIITFFLGIVLTLIWPIFGRERLRARAILVHLIATVLAVTGILILS
jgi:hypothetical protein